MVLAIQIVGAIFTLLMLYFTFLFYKKGNYKSTSFALWSLVWIAATVLLLFPETFGDITSELNFARTTDFYLTAGLMFFAVLTFWNHAHVKRIERKMEELVRSLAIKNPRKPK